MRWQRINEAQLQQLQQQLQQLQQQQQQLPHMELNERLQFFQVKEEGDFAYARFHIKIQHPPLTKAIYKEVLEVSVCPRNT